MASEDSFSPEVSDGGAVGTHPIAGDWQALVGSATGAERNLVRFGLIPVACWRVDDVRFDFDSSVVLTGARAEMQLLAA